jgi:hypothetical protein
MTWRIKVTEYLHKTSYECEYKHWLWGWVTSSYECSEASAKRWIENKEYPKKVSYLPVILQ